MNKKILLIDDDILVLKTLSKLLTREGYLIESAKTALEGLEKAKNLQVDLIICDIKMPQLDGIELVNELREFNKAEHRHNVPIMFITGYASENLPAEAVRLGITHYIIKPFDLKTLLNSVNSVLK